METHHSWSMNAKTLSYFQRCLLRWLDSVFFFFNFVFKFRMHLKMPITHCPIRTWKVHVLSWCPVGDSACCICVIKHDRDHLSPVTSVAQSTGLCSTSKFIWAETSTASISHHWAVTLKALALSSTPSHTKSVGEVNWKNKYYFSQRLGDVPLVVSSVGVRPFHLIHSHMWITVK